MNIKVLGPGCANCARLEAHVNEALAATGIDDAVVEKVTDYADIAAHGVMSTPGLVVNGTVLVSGRVPAADEVAILLSAAR
jgi:small redox-active disulfide protein 2